MKENVKNARKKSHGEDLLSNTTNENVKKAQKKWHGGSTPSDTLGSYTGIGEKGERPIQDADDL